MIYKIEDINDEINKREKEIAKKTIEKGKEMLQKKDTSKTDAEIAEDEAEAAELKLKKAKSEIKKESHHYILVKEELGDSSSLNQAPDYEKIELFIQNNQEGYRDNELINTIVSKFGVTLNDAEAIVQNYDGIGAANPVGHAVITNENFFFGFKVGEIVKNYIQNKKGKIIEILKDAKKVVVAVYDYYNSKFLNEPETWPYRALQKLSRGENKMLEFIIVNGEKYVKESSYDDFLISRGGEIKIALKQIREMHEVMDKITEEIWSEIENLMKQYDKGVDRTIQHWASLGHTITANMIASFAMENQDKYGTEMSMILNAIDDMYQILINNDIVKMIEESNIYKLISENEDGFNDVVPQDTNKDSMNSFMGPMVEPQDSTDAVMAKLDVTIQKPKKVEKPITTFGAQDAVLGSFIDGQYDTPQPTGLTASTNREYKYTLVSEVKSPTNIGGPSSMITVDKVLADSSTIKSVKDAEEQKEKYEIQAKKVFKIKYGKDPDMSKKEDKEFVSNLTDVYMGVKNTSASDTVGKDPTDKMGSTIKNNIADGSKAKYFDQQKDTKSNYKKHYPKVSVPKSTVPKGTADSAVISTTKLEAVSSEEQNRLLSKYGPKIITTEPKVEESKEPVMEGLVTVYNNDSSGFKTFLKTIVINSKNINEGMPKIDAGFKVHMKGQSGITGKIKPQVIQALKSEDLWGYWGNKAKANQLDKVLIKILQEIDDK